MNIKEKALKLSQKYKDSYEQYCKDNPGYIMHGDTIKAEVLRKASFANSLDDLKAMHRCYQIEHKSMENKPNGFHFNVSATSELINILENE